MQFVAIDFETASSARSSVCALGAVVVDNGQVVEKRAWLVRPEPLWFDPFNIMIHGITEDDVRDKPTFAQLWRGEFRPYFQTDIPVIAHNASFDMSVLRRVLDEYEISYPSLYYYCTRVIAKKAWPGLYSYALDVVADYLGIDFLHHDPTEDAEASAQIALVASSLHGAETLPDLSYLLSFKTGELFPGGYTPCSGFWDSATASKIRLNTLTPDTSDLDCDHPFYGKRVVFTGALDSMTRLEAAQRVVNCGGECINSISRSVNYLVLGQQDYRKLKGESKSSKMRKAEELIAQGADLEVIPEADFLELLGEEALSGSGAELDEADQEEDWEPEDEDGDDEFRLTLDDVRDNPVYVELDTWWTRDFSEADRKCVGALFGLPGEFQLLDWDNLGFSLYHPAQGLRGLASSLSRNQEALPIAARVLEKAEQLAGDDVYELHYIYVATSTTKAATGTRGSLKRR